MQEPEEPEEPEVSTRRGSVQKVLLKISQKSQKNICAGVFLNKDSGALSLYYKEAPVLEFFCKFCSIFKNIF